MQKKNPSSFVCRRVIFSADSTAAPSRIWDPLHFDGLTVSTFSAVLEPRSQVYLWETTLQNPTKQTRHGTWTVRLAELQMRWCELSFFSFSFKSSCGYDLQHRQVIQRFHPNLLKTRLRSYIYQMMYLSTLEILPLRHHGTETRQPARWLRILTRDLPKFIISACDTAVNLRDGNHNLSNLNHHLRH